MNQFEDSVDLHSSFGLNWSVKGTGFGQFYFYEKDGKICCANENMSKEFIKKVLCTMIDNCELEDVRDETPNITGEDVNRIN